MKRFITDVPLNEGDLRVFISEAEESLFLAKGILEKIMKDKKNPDYSKEKNNNLFKTLG